MRNANDAGGVPILGALVTWDELREAPRVALREAIGARGLPVAPLPGEPSPADAARRAVERAWPAGRRALGGWEARALPVTHGQQWPRWDVVRLEQDGGAGRCIVAESVRIEAMPEPAWTAALDMAHAGTANGVNANHSLRVSTHVSSPDTVVWTATALGDGGECDDNHDASDCRRCKTLFGDIEPRWAGAMRAARDLYYLRDVRAWVATQLRALAAGCPLRDGVYLVLRDRLPEVERIDAALEAAGAGRLTRWDVLDCDAARANARKANEETLAALMDGVVGAARQLRDGKRLHADKLAATIEEAHELIDRARWLRDVLGCATEQIEAAAEGARDVLREVAARVGVTTPAAPAGGAS